MTTTAFDGQFTVAPAELVRQPYDTAAILRRNIADMEVALRTQTDRAEAAEAELLAVREDNHSMMLEIHTYRRTAMNWQERAEKAEAELARLREQEPVAYVKYKATGGNVGLSWVAIPTGVYPNEGDPLYAAPVAALGAVAAGVPEEWREVMTELADDLTIEIDQSYPPERRAYPSEQRKYEGEMAIVNRARALLQSATTQPAVPAVPEELREFLRIALNSRPFITSTTYGGRYTVLMRFEKLGEMQDCYSALISLLQSATESKS